MRRTSRRRSRLAEEQLRHCARLHGGQRLRVQHQELEAREVESRAEVGALRLLTATAFQKLELLARPDPFGADAQVKRAADVDHGTDDRRVGGYGGDGFDE